MAAIRWVKVEEGIFRKVDATTGRAWPMLFVRYSVRGRQAIRSAHTRSVKQARLFRASKQLAGARGEPVGADRLTVAKLLDALEEDYRLNDTLSRTKRAHLALLRQALGALHPAELVTAECDRIAELQSAWKRAGVTNATINRRCNVLRRALRFAQRKGRVGVVPLVGRLDESKSRRGRYLAIPDAERLTAALAPWLRPLFVVGYDLGIRKGQLCRTRREYVDLTPGREIVVWPPAECKAREPHVVPLQGRVLELVEQAMKVAPLGGCPYLFHGPRCGKLGATAGVYGCVGDFKTALQNACRRVGLPYGRKADGYTFHSTRHSAASNLRAGGMEEADAMKVTGHKTAHVFRHYEHGQPDVLRARMAAAAAELDRQRETARARRQARGGRLRSAATLSSVPSSAADGDKLPSSYLRGARSLTPPGKSAK